MTQTAKERIEEEIKDVNRSLVYSLNKNGRAFNSGKRQGLTIALAHVENAGKSQHSKLSIPKKIAEGLDEENYKDLIDFIKEGFFVSEEVDKWYYGINQDQIDENGKFVVNKIDTNKSILIVAYLLSKTLGVDLVEVTDE